MNVITFDKLFSIYTFTFLIVKELNNLIFVLLLIFVNQLITPAISILNNQLNDLVELPESNEKIDQIKWGIFVLNIIFYLILVNKLMYGSFIVITIIKIIYFINKK
jgi:hypothetical protein